MRQSYKNKRDFYKAATETARRCPEPHHISFSYTKPRHMRGISHLLAAPIKRFRVRAAGAGQTRSARTSAASGASRSAPAPPFARCSIPPPLTRGDAARSISRNTLNLVRPGGLKLPETGIAVQLPNRARGSVESHDVAWGLLAAASRPSHRTF